MSTIPPQRFLIVRLSAIGDCIHSLPLLCALRKAYPDAFIAWMIEGRTGDLLEGHPALDRLVRVRRKWLKSPRAVLRLRRELRDMKFDVAIDSQGLTKSAVAARLSGARRRIGFRGVDGRELSPWLNNDLVEPTATHVIDRNLELLRPLGIARAEVEFCLPDSAPDAQMAETCIAALALSRGYAIVNPGAGWPSKLWAPDRYAAVARYLGEKRGLPTLVVWAGDQEKTWAESIVSGSAGFAHLAPATTLTQLAALLRRARLFVGSDTGPLHLAAAVGTRCVGLFGPMPGERNGPYGPGHVVVQKALLTGSSRERRQADNASMLAITVEDVCAACDEILPWSEVSGAEKKSA